MKKLQIFQDFTTSFSNTKNVFTLENNSSTTIENVFVFDLFELLKAFNEKLLIVFSNIRV